MLRLTLGEKYVAGDTLEFYLDQLISLKDTVVTTADTISVKSSWNGQTID
jgi:hypothetical protein